VINLFSIRCSLAFAPYLRESLSEFVRTRSTAPLVVKQGGNGLIARSSVNVLFVRHQNREIELDNQAARHYVEAIELRIQHHDIQRTSGEIVFANVHSGLLLSHPQNELWLSPAEAAEVLEVSLSGCASAKLPDWLTASASEEQLLLSDQRSGRWVVLGRDHIAQLSRRIEQLPARHSVRPPKAPVVTARGIDLPLQAAFKVAGALETFASGRGVESFQDATPDFSIAVTLAGDLLELRDSAQRITFIPREARKWAEILTSELAALNATLLARGQLRTVLADGPGGGCWILQAGDEVLLSKPLLDQMRQRKQAAADVDDIVAWRASEFLLLLSTLNSACVALTETEERVLLNRQLALSS
jgi:hypothetical protein